MIPCARIGRVVFLLAAAAGILSLTGCATDAGDESASLTRTVKSPPPPGVEESDTGLVYRNGIACRGADAKPRRVRQLYVSPGGADTNRGDSRSAPLRTLAFALCNLAPGQVLNVLPGVYHESVVMDSFGARGRRITIRGIRAGGRRPVLDGESRRSAGIALGESTGVTVANLEFRNYTDAGLSFLLGSDTVIRGNVFRDNGRASVDPDLDDEGFGVNVVGAKKVRIVGNLAIGNGPNEARRRRFALGTGIDTYEIADAVIRGNTMRGNFGGGLLVEDGANVLVERNVITGNELDANGDYWDGGIWLDGSTNVTLRGNRITANHGPGVEISDEDNQYPGASRGYRLVRNTITGNLFGLYVWNYGRCPVDNPSIVRYVNNRIKGNTRRDVRCEP